MNKYRAVIFDMDGTLLDTLTDLHASLNHALKSCGYGERSMEEVRSYIGNGMEMLIARALPDDMKVGIDSDSDKERKLIDACVEVGEEFRKFYIEHGEDNTRPYDGVMALLCALKVNNIKTAVVSNKVQEAVDRLNGRMFADIFDAAIGDREGINLKPAPDMLLEALDCLEIDKRDAIFVGDGDTDIIAAKNAGIGCISVCYGYRTEEFLRENGGVEFAHNVKELAQLLGVEI